MESPQSVAAAVLAHVETALETAGHPVGVSMVAVGAFALDECCEGVLVVAPERVYRTIDPFPTEFTGNELLCSQYPIAVDLTVFLANCVPVVDDAGNPPSVQASEEASAYLMAGAAIVWSALASPALLGDDGYGDPLWERAGMSQDFVGPAGGCLGVAPRVTLGINQWAWCIP
jgi:hypothetical protein